LHLILRQRCNRFNHRKDDVDLQSFEGSSGLDSRCEPAPDLEVSVDEEAHTIAHMSPGFEEVTDSQLPWDGSETTDAREGHSRCRESTGTPREGDAKRLTGPELRGAMHLRCTQSVPVSHDMSAGINGVGDQRARNHHLDFCFPPSIDLRTSAVSQRVHKQ